MAKNRMLSLNNVSGFSVEDLEPRMEMQMLGLGSDAIHLAPSRIVIIFTTYGEV